jgi:hypothetical protein
MEGADEVAAFDRPAKPEMRSEMGAVRIEEVNNRVRVTEGDEIDAEVP